MIKLILKHVKLPVLLSTLVLSMVFSMMNVFETIALKAVLDTRDINALYTYIGLVISILIVNLIVVISNSIIRTSFNTNINSEYIAKLLRLDNNYFKNHHSGEINNDLGGLSSITNIISVVSQIMISLSIFISTIYYINNPVIIVGMIILFPIALVTIRKLNKIQKSVKLERYTLQADKSTKINDAILGHKLMMDFNNITHEINSIDAPTHQLRCLNNRNSVCVSGFHLVIDLLQYSFMIILILLSFIQHTESSAVYTDIILIGKLIHPFLMMVTIAEPIQEAIVMFDKYKDMMTIPIEVDGTLELTTFNKSIRLSNVKFKYDDDSKYILEDINLDISKGQSIGICGPSGCGKSTLISILQKHNKDFEGTIEIDNISINEITNKSLRNMIGVVNQDTYIMSKSIMENIRYAKLDASDDEVIEATKKANLHDFIVNDLSDGYNSLVGPNGIKLSGGQRQRISIARIFLKNPEIILFDEATSALDNTSEKIISESIESLSTTKTVIIIAHRLSTIQTCDKIIVMNDNRIVEYGDHNTLKSKGGLYSQLLVS